MKTKKLGTIDFVLLGVAAVALILAIVGIAIDAIKASMMGMSMGIGWFDLDGAGVSFPGILVTVFGMFTLIATFVVCALLVTKLLGVSKLSRKVNNNAAIVAICLAFLTVLFAFIFVKALNDKMNMYKVAAGPFLLAIGAVAMSVDIFFVKDSK